MKPVVQIMQTVKSLALSVILGIAIVGYASSQEISDDHLAAAKSAIKAIGSTRQFDNILPGMAASTKTALIQNRPDLQAEITEIVDNAAIELAPRRGDLENEVANVYAKVFTEDELMAIAEFYSSEHGKKLIKETPVLAREIQAAAKVWGVGLSRDLNKSVREKNAISRIAINLIHRLRRPGEQHVVHPVFCCAFPLSDY